MSCCVTGPSLQIDSFEHPKTGKKSVCYRINYRSMDSNITTEEAKAFTDKVKQVAEEKLNVSMR